MKDKNNNNDKNVLDIKSASRRNFISGLVGLAAVCATPSVFAQKWQTFEDTNQNTSQSFKNPNQKNNDFWDHPRVLRLKRYQRNETFEGVYWKDGKLYEPGYQKVCWLMRDLSINKAYPMDVQLLNLLCAMQAWVSYYGFNKPFFISSGYRSAQYNNSLEGAAKNSMHLYGRAADIIIPDLPVSYIGQLAQHYVAGGVGFYQDRGFIHVDTGRIRSWGKR